MPSDCLQESSLHSSHNPDNSSVAFIATFAQNKPFAFMMKVISATLALSCVFNLLIRPTGVKFLNGDCLVFDNVSSSIEASLVFFCLPSSEEYAALSSTFAKVAFKKLMKKALFGSVTAVKHGLHVLHAYLEAQVRISWSIETFRFAVASCWSANTANEDPIEVDPFEWNGSFLDHLSQANARSNAGCGSILWFLLFFVWGLAATFQVSCSFIGELCFIYRFVRTPYAPWKKRWWNIAFEQLMSLLDTIFCWMKEVLRSESDLFSLAVGKDEQVVVAHIDIDDTSIGSDDDEVSETQCIGCNDAQVVPEETAEEVEFAVATPVESAMPEASPSLPDSSEICEVEERMSMDDETSCTSAVAKAAPEDCEPPRETATEVATEDTDVQQAKNHLKFLLAREEKKITTSRPIAMSALQIAAAKMKTATTTKPKVVSSLQALAASTEKICATPLQIAALKTTTKPKVVSSLHALAASTEKTCATPHVNNEEKENKVGDEHWRFSESVYEATYTTALDLSKIPKEVILRAEELANAIESNPSLEEPTESDEASDCQSQTRRLSGKSQRTRRVRSTR